MKRPGGRRIALAGLAAAALLIIMAAPFASSLPDGLERMASKVGLAPKLDRKSVRASPLAGYRFGGRGGVYAVIAGLIGVGLTFGAAFGLGMILRKRKRARCDT